MNTVRICNRCGHVRKSDSMRPSTSDTTYHRVDPQPYMRANPIDWIRDVIFCCECNIFTHQPTKEMTDEEIIAHHVRLKLLNNQ